MTSASQELRAPAIESYRYRRVNDCELLRLHACAIAGIQRFPAWCASWNVTSIPRPAGSLSPTRFLTSPTSASCRSIWSSTVTAHSSVDGGRCLVAKLRPSWERASGRGSWGTKSPTAALRHPKHVARRHDWAYTDRACEAREAASEPRARHRIFSGALHR
jgi:hypothetical protein